MKLLRTVGDQHHFQLSGREKDLLLHLIRLYPCIPCGYQRLTKGSELKESNQQLLDEALAESRQENKKLVETRFTDPKTLKPTGDSWRLSLSAQDTEWLLQVLNDVRIGSWIQLGSPDLPHEGLKAENAPFYWAMEMAGSFQMRLLELLGG